ncbi:hypothetical protein WJX73_001650 [Symbiochloris irregularis]|uniref:polyribonucleotide nucleotidyltransferase n=1 Tax=Symbiochloris irregularis TaxID=706552 RepID=A0AAW1NDY8_9CHLO
MVGGQEITLETGEIGRQANGAVMLTVGETVIYATACCGDQGADGSFLPMQVQYSERFSSAGRISGGFLKREGRPKDSDILTSRLIDRPIRPMLPKGFSKDIQILAWTLSYDSIHTPEPHAITASAAAMLISDIPLLEAVAAVRVAWNYDDGFTVNPTLEQMAKSKLDLVMAGTQDKLLMIEGFCHFLSDDNMKEAVKAGMEAISKLCKALTKWRDSVGKPAMEWAPGQPDVKLQSDTQNQMQQELRQVYSQPREKHERGAAVDNIRQSLREKLLEEGAIASDLDRDSVIDDDSSSDSETASTSGAEESAPEVLRMEQYYRAFKKAELHVVRQMVLEGRRVDGRGPSDVRQIRSRAGLLPRTHGSALFTRGETQSLAVATLGTASGQQQVDSMQLQGEQRRFVLQYFFPNSSTGETGRLAGPSRRETGHGHLAERSVMPILPTMEQFPYAVRVESTITESNGSSSMASVCAACLALRDAGVPIKGNVAGVAMGLVLDDKSDKFTILTDILGSEDHFGDMDFKVAGDADGITAFQLDVKAAGIPVTVLNEALPAAKTARRHVLEKMKECSPAPKGTLSPYAIKISRINVPLTRIGTVIGPGGRTIRNIVDRSGCSNVEMIDQEHGTFEISATDPEALNAATDILKSLVEEPEAGLTYRGVKVASVEKFGLFVEFLPEQQGLCHVSELGGELSSFSAGDTVDVKLLEVNDGKFRLSRKAVLTDDNGGVEPEEPPKPPPPPPLVEGDILR